MMPLETLTQEAIDSGEIVQVNPCQTLDPHVHPCTEYVVVLQGEIELALRQPKIGWWYRKICSRGECYEIRPYWVHTVTNLSADSDAIIQRFYQ